MCELNEETKQLCTVGNIKAHNLQRVARWIKDDVKDNALSADCIDGINIFLLIS